MNLAETHDLLTFVAAFDNRRFDDATVLAWQPIFADYPFADCHAAVTRHFGGSDAYLMPVHIRRLADEIQRERRQAEREQRLAIEAANRPAPVPTKDRSAEVYALIQQLRDSLPDTGPEVMRRAEWVEHDKRRDREATAEPNPHFEALPPPGGHPVPDPAA